MITATTVVTTTSTTTSTPATAPPTIVARLAPERDIINLRTASTVVSNPCEHVHVTYLHDPVLTL